MAHIATLAPRWGRRVAALLCVALAGLTLAACGGGDSSTSTSTGPRRAAEPADSPPLSTSPSGPSVAVGTEPEGVAWDKGAGLVAVGVRRPAQVVFVDPDAMKVVKRVGLEEPPRHLSYDAAARAILVPAEAADELIVVRPGGVVSATKVGTHPHDAAAVGDEIFVADEHSDQVSVVRGGRLLGTLGAPHQPGGIAAAGPWVALIAVSARVLATYDSRTLKPGGETPAGVGPSHIVTAGDRAYVADTQGNAILVFDIGRRPRQIGKVATPGTPYGLAIDPRRRLLWVTSTATNEVSVYSIAEEPPKRIGSYPTPRQPNSVAVDPLTGSAFVAGRTEGVLERIGPGGGGR